MQVFNRISVSLIAFTILIGFNSQAWADNYALQFDGQNDYIDCGPTEELHQIENITLECWLKTNSNNRGIIITNRHQDDGSDFPTLMFENGLAVFSLDDRLYRNDCRSNTRVTDNEWHHIAGVKEGNRWSIFVDGEEETVMNDDHELSGSQYNLHFGHHGAWNDYRLQGIVDEIRIWDIARSEDEIQATMNVSLSGNEEGLIGYWRFDEGEGQIAEDFTGNGHDGRLGSSDDADNQDPRWVESDAPIYSGEIYYSTDVLEFGPLPQNRTRDFHLILANISQIDDDWHNLEFTLTDLGEDPDWLSFDPDNGIIEVGEELEITFTASTGDIDPGDYERTVLLESNSMNEREVELTARLTIVEGTGRLFGRVTSAGGNQPIEGALVQVVADFEMQLVTDQEGRYDFEETPVFTYDLLVTAQDYLPMSAEDVSVENNQEVELDFALLHGEFNADPEWIDHELEAEESVDLPLTISNSGNGPLAWSMEIRLPENVQADPWEIRGSTNIEEILDDNMLNGVVFVDGYFYITGGNTGADINKVYVLNIDGELVREFDQFHESRYGMRDITWDGQLLWSGDDRLYGFTTDGDLRTSMRTDAGSYRSLTWDPQHNLFWTANVTSNIIGIDTDGQMQDQIARPQGMSIYGLAYWTDDPDGYNLYIFTRGEDTDLAVFKARIEDGDIIPVTELNFNGGRPGGISVTNRLDPYSWLLVSMVQNPDHLVVWHLASRTDWLQVDSFEGVIDAGDGTELTVTLSSQAMAGGTELNADLYFSHDGSGGSFELPVTLNVAGGDADIERRTLSLHEGWNLISVNVQPANDDVRELMQPLVEEDLLMLVKDQDGHFYFPGLNFINIERWVSVQGYLMKLAADGELTIEGEVIAWDTPIALRDGWNMVSYLPRDPVDVRVALRNIVDVLLLAKNGLGHFYFPRLDYSNIGDMLEGQGYFMKMEGEVELVYNFDEEEQLVSRLTDRRSSVSRRITGFAPVSATVSSRSVDLSPTGVSFSLLLLTGVIEPGTLIEAYTASGLLAGRGIVGTDGMCGMALWGDDPTTDETDGFLEGEAVRLTISSNGSTNRLISVESSPVWTADGFGVVDVSVETVPVEFGISSAYPNPFNGMLRIEFALERLGQATIKAYDLTGREVAVIVEGEHTAGIHTTVWNAEGLPGGIYIISLKATGNSQTKKILLLK